MNHRSKLVVAVAAFCAARFAFALSPGETVDNFRLLDHQGGSRELYYLSDMKAVVLMSQGNGCEASRQAVPGLKALRDQYRTQGVEVLLIDSNLPDTSAAIAKAAADQGIDMPILIDDTQLIGEALDLRRNGEVLVIDPQGWKLAYRGPLSAGSSNYAADAVDALVNAQPVKTAKVEMKGCAIAMPERDKKQAHAKISYSKTIAPMLIDNCVTCHRTGGIGPWQMSSYDMVKGFAPMIREVVRTQRMPPWHADPHYQAFSNDRSLSKDEAKTLVHWIEAGTPRGSRRRSARGAEAHLARVGARRARPDRRDPGVRRTGDRHDSVPDAERGESARSRRVGARGRLPAGRSHRAPSHHRHDGHGRRRHSRRRQPRRLRARRGRDGAAARKPAC